MSRTKHGAYRLKLALEHGQIDGRSAVGQALKRLRSSFETSLGGQLSMQEAALVDRAVVKLVILESIERWALQQSQLIAPDGRLPGVLARNYLSWSAELRRDLQALGLSRRSKDAGTLEALLNEAANDTESEVNPTSESTESRQGGQ